MRLYDEHGQRVYLLTAADMEALKGEVQNLVDEALGTTDDNCSEGISQSTMVLLAVIEKVEERA